MKHRTTTKIAAFLLSGTLLAAGTAGILPGIRQTGLPDSGILTAEAAEWEGSSYTKTYKNIVYTFKVKEDKDKGIYEAQITGFRPNSSYPADVWIPSSVTCNGRSYRVTEVNGSNTMGGSQVTSKATRIFIPYTVKSIGQFSFNAFSALKSVLFVDDNNFATDSISACGIKYACYNSFSATCSFIKNQMDKNGFALVGNCLLKLSASNPTTYVCRRAMGDVNQNGSVDIADAQLIKNWLTKKTNLTKFQQVLCDVDRSGTVDVRDANLISEYYNEALIGYSYNSFEQFYDIKHGTFNQFKP